MGQTNSEMEALIAGEYAQGFITQIDSDTFPPGLDEAVVRAISERKGEPEWMLQKRLEAYRHWLTMDQPDWAAINHPPIDFQQISYYSSPKQSPKLESLDQVDPEILATYEKLGISIEEQKALAGVAVDAVFDSVSVATTFRESLAEAGVIFCAISEALRDYPELVRQYMASVVPHKDNFFAALNSAVFSDGTFVYIPKGVKCPMELSTYFRINEAKT
ncbi:MAG: Fe-S cluster assembly protein SufB, partial [Candidatus Thiodiazotropha taylori]